jgi:hypothetical protein
MIDVLLICLGVLGIIVGLTICLLVLASVYAIYDLDRELTEDLTDE